MMGTTYNDKTQKVGITLPNSLIKQTGKLRGDIPRSTYIRRAVKQLYQSMTDRDKMKDDAIAHLIALSRLIALTARLDSIEKRQ